VPIQSACKVGSLLLLLLLPLLLLLLLLPLLHACMHGTCYHRQARYSSTTPSPLHPLPPSPAATCCCRRTLLLLLVLP
jgi:hypothetical protein